MKQEKLKILVVDDVEIIRRNLTEMLNELDGVGPVLNAGNYMEALKLLEEERPDVLLLDINLPGKSGVELLRTIKAKNWKLQIIMITNQANEYYKNLCKSLGSHYFFDKSNEFEKIPLAISLIQLN